MKFDYNPRILEQLGTELITSDEVAFTELLKNSYDAKAKEVRVHFLDSFDKLEQVNLLNPLTDSVRNELVRILGNNNIIVIEDDGIGMNQKRLKEGFFKVGSDLKERLKRAEENAGKMDVMTLGDKGLGRLASQRLANFLIVETCSDDESHINFIVVEWKKFFKDLEAETQDMEFPKIEDHSYTRLWFLGNVDFSKFIDNREPSQFALFDQKSSREIYLNERLQSSVSFLYSPFEQVQEEFKIRFLWNNIEIKSLFPSKSINVAETIHSFRIVKEKTLPVIYLELDLRPWYVELIHLRLLGKNLFTERKKDAAFYSTLLQKYRDRLDASLKKRFYLEGYLNSKEKFNPYYNKALEEILPIEGEVFAFHREPYRLNISVNSAKDLGILEKQENINSIRDFLNYHNGIKLYRDKFRIANLGDKESDWLNLQQARTKGQQFFRFELGNVIGYVKINDFYQKYIKEISSRQELKESMHASALKFLLQYIFNYDFYQLSSAAYYLIRDILDEEGLIPKNTPKELKEQVEESEVLLKATLENLNVFQNSFKAIKENITLDTPEKIQRVQKIIIDLEGQDTALSESINSSITTLKNAKDTLYLIEERQKESYNNYKLMANGLITEVMTHELHSILLNIKSGIDYNGNIERLKNYLLENEQIVLYKDQLRPVGERMNFLHTRIQELDRFYNFLERTFIKQGTHDDFESENIPLLIDGFRKRLEQRLRELKVEIIFSGADDYSWYVPKGSLTHILYNLIDNSLYWIAERQKRSAYDVKYKIQFNDSIEIKVIDSTTIHYTDSGTGVLNEMQYTLFHPFKSGKKDGRGMGLYIVKHLLESFGGSLELLPDKNTFENRHIFSLSMGSNGQE